MVEQRRSVIRRRVESSSPSTCWRGVFAIRAILPLVLLQAALGQEAAEADRDRKLLLAVAEAARQYEFRVPKGAGTANTVDQVTVNGSIEQHEERILQFRFKGQLSRTEVYRVSESGDQREGTFAISPGGRGLRYTDAGVYVTPEPPGMFDEKLGLDFRPQVLNRHKGLGVSSWLERICSKLSEQEDLRVSARTTQEGVLEFEIEGEAAHNGTPYRAITRMRIDTKNGLHLLLAEDVSDGIMGPGTRRVRRTSYEWRRHGEQWFPKTVKTEWETKGYIEFGLGEETNPDAHYHRQMVIEVSAFDPQAEVSDSDFTLAGLGVPHGTNVYDEFLGISYNYDEAINEKELSAALEFLPALHGRASAAHTGADGTAAWESSLGPGAETVGEPSDGPADASPASCAQWVLWTTVVVAGAALTVVGIWWGLARRRRDRGAV